MFADESGQREDRKGKQAFPLLPQSLSSFLPLLWETRVLSWASANRVRRNPAKRGREVVEEEEKKKKPRETPEEVLREKEEDLEERTLRLFSKLLDLDAEKAQGDEGEDTSMIDGWS